MTELGWKSGRDQLDYHACLSHASASTSPAWKLRSETCATRRQISSGGGGGRSRRRRMASRRDWWSFRVWTASFGPFLRVWTRRALFRRGASIPHRTWLSARHRRGVERAARWDVSCARGLGGGEEESLRGQVDSYRLPGRRESNSDFEHGGSGTYYVNEREWAGC